MERYGPPRTKSQDELRESFYRLLQRSYLVAEKRGQGLAVYRAIARTLRGWCGEAWVQATMFPFEASLVRQFLAQTQLPAENPRPIVARSLTANSWKAVADGILQALNGHDFAELCQVSGAERLHASKASGRGVVIAHSHTVFAQLFWKWLEHEGIAEGVTTWKWAWHRGRDEITDPKVKVIESARELHAAMGSLRQGGLVHIVADGDKGSRELPLPFCNRLRGFRPSFAELAVATNSPVITADVNLAEDGGIRIEIGAPLEEPSPASDRAARVDRLVRRYAEHLRRRWEAHPHDLPWFVMRQQLLLPRL